MMVREVRKSVKRDRHEDGRNDGKCDTWTDNVQLLPEKSRLLRQEPM